MKKITLLKSIAFAAMVCVGYTSKAQFSFANTNSLIPTATHSGCAVTVVDVNNDGLDDMLIMDQSTTLVLELQNQNGTYTRTSLGNISGNAGVWGMAAADVDHNGWKDVVTGTNGTLYLVKLFSNAGVVTSTTTTLSPGYFVQNVTFGDFNNDGWIDVGVCDDVNFEKIYINDGAGNLARIVRSNTSNTIGTGSKTFTTAAGLPITVGQTVQIGYNGLNYMTGTVTAFAGTTLVVNVTSFVGSGTYTGWSINQTIVFNTEINPGLTYGGDPYDSGNYGSVWLDFDNDGDLDFYIAHCRQSTSSYTDQRRRDRLFVNDGNGHYTESEATYGFETGASPYKQGWTTSFGDIDNDGDFDVVVTNHGENGQVLQNDGTGHYTDITTASGFNTTSAAIAGGMDPIEATVEDFDNDGFLDILVTGGGGADSYVMYHNNGNSTFTLMNAPFPSTTNGMLSFGTGDLNHDGKMDVFVSYGNVYNTPTGTADVLYLNTTTNTNHYITFSLTGTVSNVDAIGARVTIYGPWGKQIREVRAGDAYGTSNTMQLHFGIGAATTVDSARIDWPSHQFTNHFTNLVADQFVTVIEGQCSITGNTLAGGPYTLCSSQSQTLTAAAGFSSYLWSNSLTTQSISVTGANAGSYSVTVSNAGGCTNISPVVSVILNTNGLPIITASSTTASCPGTITLTSTVGGSYQWAGPSGFSANTQTVTPMEAGAYTVTTTGGGCGTATSLPLTVALLAAPSPTGTGAASATPAALTLSAAGSGGILNWYDLPSAGTLLGTGATYTTPVISTTTTYYVDESTTNGGVNGNTGQPYHTGASFYSGGNGTNGGIDFNVIAPSTLVSVKVYTNTAGTREIQLKNSAGTVINSLSINIPVDSTVITLNFPLAVGTGYRLTTNGAVNTTSFGGNAPVLQRSSTGVVYPYGIAGLINLTNGWTGTTTSTTTYYYFYDWVVTQPSVTCTSPRVPVIGTIGSVGIDNVSINNGIQVYPNPASGSVNVTFQTALSSTAVVELTDIAGRTVSTWSIDKPTQGQNVKLNVSDVNAGTYFLNITTDAKKTVQKLVLTK